MIVMRLVYSSQSKVRLPFWTKVLPLRFSICLGNPCTQRLVYYYGERRSNHNSNIFEQLRRYFVMSGAMLGLKTVDQSEHFIAVGICKCKVGNRGISKIGTENVLAACINCIRQIWADGSKIFVEFISNCRNIAYLTSINEGCVWIYRFRL